MPVRRSCMRPRFCCTSLSKYLCSHLSFVLIERSFSMIAPYSEIKGKGTGKLLHISSVKFICPEVCLAARPNQHCALKVKSHNPKKSVETCDARKIAIAWLQYHSCSGGGTMLTFPRGGQQYSLKHHLKESSTGPKLLNEFDGQPTVVEAKSRVHH